MRKITILGDGAFGTAMAVLLAVGITRQITLWSARPDSARQLRETRENVRLLPGVRLTENIRLCEDPEQAAQADVILNAIPTVHLRGVLRRFRGIVPVDTPIVSLTKGIENDTFLRPSETIAQELGSECVVVLSGPSHAEEVARGLPTSVVIAGDDDAPMHELQELLASERFRVYTSGDVVGVEMAGALKNVIAIAAGMCDGLGFGDNAKAALLTRGLVEMARFGVAHGAEHATFQGLAGLGDLMTTCFSPHGRNRGVGIRIGKGESLENILAGSPKIAEGVTTSRSVFRRAAEMRLEVPIMSGVYRVLHEGVSPRAAFSSLMARRVGHERSF